MSTLAVAKRYGQAIFELASEKKILDQVEKELVKIIETIDSSEDLKKITEHQLLAAEVKQEIFRKVFADELSPITLNFLLLILQKKREAHLSKIVHQFVDLANEARGVVKANVKSAVKLSSEQIDALRKSLEKITGKSILIELEIDEKIMGGLIVRIGDRIIDGSVQNKLKMLEKHLKSVGLD